MTSPNGDYLSFVGKNVGLTTMEHWQEHNRSVLRGEIIGVTDENASITKNCIVKANQIACDDFSASTDQLRQRARHIEYWRAELERAIRDMDTEINALETLRQQLKNSIDTLKIPEQITRECLTVRCYRMQSDSVYDEPQDRLYKESVLIENVERMQADMLRDIENQLKINATVKSGLERDWSDKCLAFKYESANSELETKATNVKDSAGAAKLCEGQSDVQSWEYHTVNMLDQFKTALDRSKSLRDRVEAALMNSARDLRSQDIAVNGALSERIARTDRVKTQLENQLKLMLEKIVETENVLGTLHGETMRLSQRLRVAQTRLNTKSRRPNVENCREGSLLGLLEEVRDLNDAVGLMRRRSLETEKLRAELIHERSKLENEIVVKKKTIYIDDKRCLFLRSHFQSAEKLCGF